jgi:hypothetical protein
MLPIRIVAIPTQVAEAVRATLRAPVYGFPAHAEVATDAAPCRHCLRAFVAGKGRRILFTTMSALSTPFLSALLSFHLKEFFSFVSFLFFLLCIDDHGSFVIWRSDSVRPKHLTDQNFDHDYFFKLPLTRERDAQSSGRRFTSRHVR